MADQDALEIIFVHGQNDFQPIEGQRSVTVGDVIRFRGKRYRVEKYGFTQLGSL